MDNFSATLDSNNSCDTKSLISINVQDTVALSRLHDLLVEVRNKLDSFIVTTESFKDDVLDRLETLEDKGNQIMAGLVELQASLGSLEAALTVELAEIAAALAAIQEVDLSAEVARIDAVKAAIEGIIVAPPVEPPVV